MFRRPPVCQPLAKGVQKLLNSRPTHEGEKPFTVVCETECDQALVLNIFQGRFLWEEDNLYNQGPVTGQSQAINPRSKSCRRTERLGPLPEQNQV